MEKRDISRELGEIYKQPKNKITLVDIPKLQFIMINGEKDPNQNPDYSDAVGALYSVAYKIKFTVKKGPLAIDYKVMPLEGLWWAENMDEFSLEDRENWKWTMMIMQPDFINKEMFLHAQEETLTKKDNQRIKDIRFETFTEGLSMQIFHKGPYGVGEIESINRLHNEISTHGYERSGKHHEIFFNSPLRTAPENLKTIIRQPVLK